MAVVACCGVVALGLAGCQPSAAPAHAEGGVSVEVDLAPLMAEFQRHSAKLGFAVAAHNQPLARFYVKELREVLDEVEKVKEDEGIPIADTARVILPEPLGRLDHSLGTADWPRAWSDYEAVIAGCNRCHAATGHEYVKIVPARDPSTWNQDFSP